jgi:phage recombination protein Bet
MTAPIATTDRIDFTPDQIGLVKRTICQGATDDELQLFLGQCRRTGLDPFSRQIHAVKRWDNRQKREVMSIQVGIDGFRLVAERTGQTDGQEGPLWCGDDGVWKDVWLSVKPPAACKVAVFRKGQGRGYVGIATWAEYAQRGKEGQLIGLWAKMPSVMLAKCAESLALRKAFPADLSGLYSPEEVPGAEPDEAVEARAEKKEPPKAEAATEPPKQLPAKAEPAQSEDPVHALNSLHTLLKSKGKTWNSAIAWLSQHTGTGYDPQKTAWVNDVPEDHRKVLVEAVRKMPAPQPQQKAG